MTTKVKLRTVKLGVPTKQNIKVNTTNQACSIYPMNEVRRNLSLYITCEAQTELANYCNLKTRICVQTICG